MIVFGVLVLAIFVLAIWLTLVLARGKFWTCLDNDFVAAPEPAVWPKVVAVVPARDEAEVIAQSIGGLLAQDYPGDFHVVLVDDQSSDGTAKIARALDHAGRLTVLGGAALPPGWAGKLWAVAQGLRFARENFSPDYVLLTDADIFHEPGNLRALVSRAKNGGYGLVSLMALLRCESFAEKLLIPAFVYFFQMLYPFRWTRDPRQKTAGAAGGCMLARADLLEQAGGIEAIRGALIDDCALGARMKSVGPIWLGLTRSVVSLRPYPRMTDIGKMISRSAYAQLGYSPLQLVGALAGMVVTYLLPLWLALRAPGAAGLCGALALGLMVASFMPINRFYGLGRARGLLLPVVALVYMFYTLRSAVDFYLGRGGMWKGRAQALIKGAEQA